MLGPFGVWRGDIPVTNKEWQREKARQLFQLLLTIRGQWLQREQIVDLLWPELDPESAERNFKVALNALNHALEPERQRLSPPYFVIRQGNTYGINPQANVVTDTEQLQALSLSNDEEKLRFAYDLYEDEYLPECRYMDWSAVDRDRYRQIYFSIVERLSLIHLQNQKPVDAMELCQSAFQRDKSWEKGYALMMRAYSLQGNIAQVQQTFQRCELILREELGLDPSQETQRLRHVLTKNT